MNTDAPATNDRPIPFWVQALAVGAVVALVYSNIYRAEWVFDDESNILVNGAIHDVKDTARIFRYHPGRFVGYWSFALNYHLWGDNPWPYRVINVTIHLWGALALLAVLRMALGSPAIGLGLTERERDTFALLGALVFACHPLQTQAVTYVVQRFESLACAFTFTSVALYMKARMSEVHGPPIRAAGRFALYVGMFVSMALGVLTKQTVAVTPALVVAVDLLAVDRSWKRIGRRLALVAPLAALTGLVVYITFGVRGSRLVGGRGPNAWNYLLTQAWVHLKYMRLVVAPYGQNLDYDIALVTSLADPRVWAGLAGITASLAVAWFARKKAPLVTLGIVWYYITLSVTSSFVPILDVMFEHRLYPALGGVAIAMAGLAVLRPRWRSAARTAGVVIVVALAATANMRNYVWQTKISLWKDVVEKAPINPRACYNYAHALFLNKQYDGAEQYLQRAMKLRYEYGAAYDLQGQILSLRGRGEEAEKFFRKAVAASPKDAVAWNNFALMLVQAGRHDEAREAFEKAVRLRVGYAEAFNNLGLEWLRAGRIDKAVEAFERALKSDRAFVNARKNLARALAMSDRFDRAARTLLDAIRLAPARGDLTADLGRVYLLAGKTDEAEKWLRQALEEPDGRRPALENLVELYWKKGDRDAARNAARQLLEVDPVDQTARDCLRWASPQR